MVRRRVRQKRFAKRRPLDPQAGATAPQTQNCQERFWRRRAKKISLEGELYCLCAHAALLSPSMTPDYTPSGAGGPVQCAHHPNPTSAAPGPGQSSRNPSSTPLPLIHSSSRLEEQRTDGS